MFPLMNLIITKWLLVYVLENKHNFYVIHFLSLTVLHKATPPFMTNLQQEPKSFHDISINCTALALHVFIALFFNLLCPVRSAIIEFVVWNTMELALSLNWRRNLIIRIAWCKPRRTVAGFFCGISCRAHSTLSQFWFVGTLSELFLEWLNRKFHKTRIFSYILKNSRNPKFWSLGTFWKILRLPCQR